MNPVANQCPKERRSLPNKLGREVEATMGQCPPKWGGASSAMTCQWSPLLRSSRVRLWCTIRVVGAERSLDALSGDALRHRHPEPGHPVQHRAADPGFGLLGRQSPGAQAATDD